MNQVRTIRFPSDIESYPEFQRLEECLRREGVASRRVLAHHIVFSLLMELAYQCVFQSLGCIKKEDVVYLERRIKRMDPDTLFEPANEVPYMKWLVESRWLIEHADLYYCLLFAALNEELAAGFRASHADCHEVVIWNKRNKHFNDDAPKILAGLPKEYYEVVDGVPISKEEMNRVLVSIMNVDAIFQRRGQRKQGEFGVGLIQDACREMRSFGPERFNVALRRLQEKRKMVGLPRTAERFFADVRKAFLMIEPDEGWAQFARLVMQGKELPLEKQEI